MSDPTGIEAEAVDLTDSWAHCPCGYATGNPNWWDNHRSRCDAQWGTTEAEAS